MNNTFQTIQRAMNSQGWKFQLIDDANGPLMTGFSLARYGSVNLVIHEADSLLVIGAASVYQVPPDHPCKAQVMEALLVANWNTKIARFEFDPDDGEVRLAVEMPLEDAVLTEAQFLQAFRTLVEALDSNHEAIVRALEPAGEKPGANGKDGLLGTTPTKVGEQDSTDQRPHSNEIPISSAEPDMDTALAALLGEVDDELRSPAEAMEPDTDFIIAAPSDNEVEMPQIFIDLCSFHPLTTFHDMTFLRLLEESLSLSIPEKKRVIDAIPTLSQFQIDQLIKVFEEERREFVMLMPREAATIEALKVEKAAEWQQLARDYYAEVMARFAEMSASTSLAA